MTTALRMWFIAVVALLLWYGPNTEARAVRSTEATFCASCSSWWDCAEQCGISYWCISGTCIPPARQ